MVKKIFIILTFIGFAATAITLHFHYDWFRSFNINAINAVPSSAAIILECKNTQPSWRKLAATQLWKDLSEQKYLSRLNKNYHALDSLIIRNPDISSIITEQTAVLSAHPIKIDDYDFLYILKLPRYKGESYINNIIADLNPKTKINKRRYEDANLYEIEIPFFEEKQTFTYSIIKGLYIGSFSSLLVEEAIRQLNKDSNFNEDKIFAKVRDVAGAKVDANIYINFKMLPSILTTYLSAQNYKAFKFMKYFAQWAEMDLKIKENALMFNGFTASNDSLPTYMNIFLKQEPQKINVTKFLPQNTAALMYFGLSDFPSFYKDYSEYVKNYDYLDAFKNALDKLSTDYNISVEQDILPWVGNEYAFALIEQANVARELTPAAFVHCKNVEQALKSFESIIKNVKKDLNEEDVEMEIRSYFDEYNGHTIKYLNMPNLLGLLFGDIFKTIETPYYVVVEDYLIFANDPKTIYQIIDRINAGRTLSKDPRYLKFTENISEEANFYLYINSPKVLRLVKQFASDEFQKKIEENLPYFKKFSHIGMQLSTSNDMFYSTIYLQYDKSLKENTRLVWQRKLDAPAMTPPQIVTNHYTNEKEIIIQDSTNRLYLISSSGAIIWKIQLKSAVKSKVRQIDFYNNNKIQYLFNTQKQIHLIDRKGRKVENYPINLKAPATNGLSLFDYNNKKEYRIFIACDNQVYAYKANGKLITEWGPRNVKGTITKEIQHLRVENKDFIIALTNSGNIHIMDRRGKTRVKVKDKIPSVSNNPLIISHKGTIESVEILCTDTTGLIYKTYLSGKSSTKHIGEHTSKHLFQYYDINSDDVNEYIFVDKGKLRVFENDSTELFTYWFNSNITTPIQNFNFGGTGKISISSYSTNEVFLFNEDGTIFNGFPLKGSTSSATTDLLHDGSLKMVVGSLDGNLYVYG
ncbi:MAG: DUF3352 domain-containing protein, partial [Bacteroidia bacterium]|nr:DUF3352 domain-containing protein [Bacteroidia bacterium]